MTREPTASLLSGNVDYIDEIDTSLLIEANVIKLKTKTIRKLKYDYVFLLKDVEINLYDKTIEIDTEKRKYEQVVS